MTSSFKLFVAFITVALFAECTQTKWLSSSFDKNKTDIDTVTVLFPQVKYYGKTVGNKYLLRGKSIYVSNGVGIMIKEIINGRYFLEKSIAVSPDSIKEAQWLTNHFLIPISDSSKRLDTIKVLDDGRKILHLSNELKQLADYTRGNYFIYIKGTAIGTSEDAKRFDAIQLQTFKLFYGNNYAYNYQWDSLQLHIYLVDKRSGEILWYNYNKDDDTKYHPMQKEEVKRLLIKLLVEN